MVQSSATLYLVSDECGGQIDIQEGEIAHFVSARYPGFFRDETSCNWTVHGPAGKGLIVSQRFEKYGWYGTVYHPVTQAFFIVQTGSVCD